MSNPNLPKYPDVSVQLSGRDGNAFTVIGAIGAIGAALRKQVGNEAANEWAAAAFDCDSYDDLLRLVMSTVEVS